MKQKAGAQISHHGATSSQAEAQIHAEYEKLFFPSESKWREKALADCRQAFEGIFTAYDLLKSLSWTTETQRN